MTAKQIFSKTRPFCMAKLALGFITILISTVVFLVLLGIGWLFGEGGIFLALLLWIAATGAINKLLNHGVGYLIKAGHIAVIAEAMKTGQVPKDQVEYGKQMVTQKFGTTGAYFAIDKLVSGAVKQIQNGLEKLGNKLDFIPGMEALTSVAKFFVSISLGYIDECCFGWVFYNPQQGAFQSSADALVIYAQNWKPLLKGAGTTMVKVVLGVIGTALAIFIPVGVVFKIFKWSPLIAFVLACLISWVVKVAFYDSFMMCQMMTAYMEVAPSTTLAFDLYGQLSGMSADFRELHKRAKEENSMNAVFCSNCGAENESSVKFCGSCGNPMR